MAFEQRKDPNFPSWLATTSFTSTFASLQTTRVAEFRAVVIAFPWVKNHRRKVDSVFKHCLWF